MPCQSFTTFTGVTRSPRFDWVVEPAFAPMVERVEGITRVIECPLRDFRKGWWKQDVRKEWRAFRHSISLNRYDTVLDLQGLTKSAIVARMARGADIRLCESDGRKFL